MGCGQSSLKGADVPNLNSQPVEINRPMKKVATNFSDVNYDQDPQQQRRLTEYGPDETPRQHPPSQQPQGGGMLATSPGQGNYDPMGAASPGFGSGIGAPGDVGYPHQGRGIDRSDPNPNLNRPGFNDDPNDASNGTALEPYQTTDAGDWDNNNDNYQSHGGGQYQGQDRDPTSAQAKDDFAQLNDPASPMNQEGSRYEGGGQNHQHHDQHGYDDNDDDDDDDDGNGNENGRSPSWLGQRYASYQAAKQGRGVSDDDLKKYTGKDRAEFDEWAAQQPGVAGRQLAMDPQSASGGSYVAS